MNQKTPLYLIESFIVAAKASSFDAAANQLGITQSTLSKQMILLQESLPHKIFAQEGRKKILTKYGESLYQNLNDKFSGTQEVIEQTSQLYSESKNIHLKICGRGEFLDILAAKLRGDIAITYIPMDSRTALDCVIHRKVDVAITHEESDSLEIIKKPFLKNEFVFAISKSLLKNKPKSEAGLIDALKSFPCLQYRSEDPIVKNLIKAWGMNLSELSIYRTYPNYAALTKMVSSGLGWALLPSRIELDPKENHIIPISTGLSIHERKFYIYYRKEISSAPWLKKLLEEMKFN